MRLAAADRQAFALNVLHDDVVGFVLAPHVKDRTDVRMTQTGERLRFALESGLDVGSIGQVQRENLDGHDPLSRLSRAR